MSDREPGATSFVILVWLASAASLLVLAWFYTVETPLWDDWANVAVLTGERPLTMGWLWSLHNEHRIALPRLIYISLAWLTGASFRAQALLNAILLIVATGSLIRAARNLRGWTSYADAFLPLIFCGVSHQRNVLFAFQIQLILSTVLLAFAVHVVSRRPSGLGTPSAGLMAVMLLLLPLCGANGLGFVPAIALAMIYQAVLDWRQSRLRAVLLVAGAVLGGILIVLYFRNYHSLEHTDEPASLMERFRIAMQLLATGWGDSAFRTWPWSGWLEGLVIAGGVAALLVNWIRGPERRMRTTWLIALFGAVGSLAIGIGWGRGGWTDRAGFETRYVTLAAPALAIAYLAWCEAGSIAMRFAQMTMFALACIAVWPNTEGVLKAVAEHKDRFDALARDIAAGLPPSRLIPRHQGFLHNSHDDLYLGMPMMKKARLGLYARMADDPPFREISLSKGPTSMTGMTGQEGHFRSTMVDPYLNYTLPAPLPVAGVRLRFRHSNPQGLPARFLMLWSNDANPGRTPPGRHSIWKLATREDKTIIVWTDATIDHLRIQPDNKRCEFDVEDLTLLIANP
ncbi:hypothetical protein [Singulisphaera sp. PoT]|uniref:hypothetical protein n=1 Tax=Singulisphaera sp. PoT TaxID=3411797 RepID=UPI003BF46BD5